MFEPVLINLTVKTLFVYLYIAYFMVFLTSFCNSSFTINSSKLRVRKVASQNFINKIMIIIKQ